MFAMFWAQSDTVKGAVLGAFVAMVGIFINGVVSGWNTHRQLANDREQRAKERSLTLRRDIYLGVAQHMQDCLQTMLYLGDISLTHAQAFAKQRDSAHFVAKIHLMAHPAMVAAVIEATNALTAAIVAIRLERETVLRQRQEIDRLLARIQEHRRVAADVLNAIRARGIDGPIEKEKLDWMGKLHQRELAEANSVAKEHDALLVPLDEARAKLSILVAARQRECYPALIAVAGAARAELGEDINMTAYQQMVATAYAIDEPTMRRLHGLPAVASGG